MNFAVRIDPEPDVESARFTVADYEQMMESDVFADMRVELVRGELVKMMPGGFAHGESNATLIALLYPAFRGVARIAAGLAVRVGPDTVRGPDVAVVTSDVPRRGVVDAAQVLLAVEIAVSSARRDLIEKRGEYAAAGIPTYWVVDPDAAIVHVFSDPRDGDYAAASEVRFDQPLALPVVGGAITIAE
jgi:Uma2 family endonuclease